MLDCSDIPTAQLPSCQQNNLREEPLRRVLEPAGLRSVRSVAVCAPPPQTLFVAHRLLKIYDLSHVVRFTSATAGLSTWGRYPLFPLIRVGDEECGLFDRSPHSV